MMKKLKGIKLKMAKRALQKADKQIEKAKPGMTQMFVTHDDAYNRLAAQINEINSLRQTNGKWYYELVMKRPIAKRKR
jgi:hypothetical protein